MLTPENWKQGFLLDEEWMAGVSEEAAQNQAATPPRYAAFVIDHATGEYVGYHLFEDLQSALDRINAIPRAWKFESTSECGGGNCGSEHGEGCGKGACHQSCQATGACELES